jgi:hypothetical protein
MNLVTRRLAELGAIVMIGDGVVAALKPKGHVRLWERGPKLWRDLLEPFAKRPGLTRAVAVGEIGLGVLLARIAIRDPAEQRAQREG